MRFDSPLSKERGSAASESKFALVLISTSFLVLANPAIADVFTFYGTGVVTESYLANNCGQFGCLNDIPIPEVGSPTQFTITANVSVPTGGTGYVYASTPDFYAVGGGYYDGFLQYGQLYFENNQVVSLDLYKQSPDDVCGGGGHISISGGMFSYSSMRCGYEYPLSFPYPDIFESGAGRVTEYDNGAFVPEPTTWGLVLVGFATIGAALRGRRRYSLWKAPRFP